MAPLDDTDALLRRALTPLDKAERLLDLARQLDEWLEDEDHDLWPVAREAREHAAFLAGVFDAMAGRVGLAKPLAAVAPELTPVAADAEGGA